MSTKQRTLFERVGGEQVIAKIVHQFYDRVIADPELKPFFKDTSMEKLRRMQREFFSAAMGGPSIDTGKPLGHIHHGKGITKHHFALYVGHLLETLQGLEIDEQDVQDLISRISTYAEEITGVGGSLG